MIVQPSDILVHTDMTSKLIFQIKITEGGLKEKEFVFCMVVGEDKLNLLASISIYLSK